jgi:hypothetical protein
MNNGPVKSPNPAETQFHTITTIQRHADIIRPEDSNCNDARKVGKSSTNDANYLREAKLLVMFSILSTVFQLLFGCPIYKTARHKPVLENPFLGDLYILHRRRSHQGGSDIGFITHTTCLRLLGLLTGRADEHYHVQTQAVLFLRAFKIWCLQERREAAVCRSAVIHGTLSKAKDGNTFLNVI